MLSLAELVKKLWGFVVLNREKQQENPELEKRFNDLSDRLSEAIMYNWDEVPKIYGEIISLGVEVLPYIKKGMEHKKFYQFYHIRDMICAARDIMKNAGYDVEIPKKINVFMQDEAEAFLIKYMKRHRLV